MPEGLWDSLYSLTLLRISWGGERVEQVVVSEVALTAGQYQVRKSRLTATPTSKALDLFLKTS